MAGGAAECSGVAVLLRAGHYRELHTDKHKYWVMSAFRHVDTGTVWVVAGAYVPPRGSSHYDKETDSMGGYLEEMLDQVRTLQMRFHVPNT